MAREKNGVFKTAKINPDTEDRLNGDSFQLARQAFDTSGEGAALEKGPTGGFIESSVRHLLSGGSFSQNWTNIGLITTNDDWSGVPGIVAYLGDISPGTTADVDARTLTGAALGDIDVNAEQTNPNFTAGGVAEFHLANPTVALQGSGTADAPSMVIYLDATGCTNIRFQCNLRDIDGTGDNAVQQVNIQYRTTAAGTWTNVPGGYFADVTTGGTATQVTAVDVVLPAGANGAAELEIRIMTTNAGGNDEWVGVDDIVVSTIGALAINDVTQAEGAAGTSNFTFTVSRTGGSSGAVGATYTLTLSGAAAAGDFTVFPQTGTVSFANGETSKQITITVFGDFNVELDELFTVVLSAPTGGATLADATGQGTITNDDFPINGTPGNDPLNGTVGDDVINGLGGHDRLLGNAGNDTLNGGDGDDYISGGTSAGGGPGSDIIDGGTGFDRAGYFTNVGGVGVTVSLLLQGSAQNTGSQGMDTLTNIENLSGSVYADVLTGDEGNNWLWGSTANSVGNFFADNDDTISGMGGNDLITVGIGDHLVDGGADEDTFRFTENGAIAEVGITVSLALQGGVQASGYGSWTLSNFENLSGGQGGDTLTGDGNANRITGEGGNDSISGGGGNDTLSGDLVYDVDTHGTGYSGQATLILATDEFGAPAFSGNDSLDGGMGEDTALYWFQGPGTLTIVGNAIRLDGVNVATIAYAGADVIVTGVGAGAHIGTDTLTGIEHIQFSIQGTGAVTYDVAPPNVAPTIANLDGDSFTQTEGVYATHFLDVDRDSLITDPDSANFDGGSLTVTYTSPYNGVDILGIYGDAVTDYDGSGNVTVNDIVIGTVTGGATGFPYTGTMTITFNANATPAAVELLMRAIFVGDQRIEPEAGDRTLSITLTDGDGGSSSYATSFTVVGVNDAPSGTDNTITMNEDASRAFTAADFGFNDLHYTFGPGFAVDDGDSLQAVIITTLPLAGILRLNGVAVTAGQSIAAADIPNLTFTPAPDANGTGYASFTFQVQDNGGTSPGQDTDQSPNTIVFNVAAVNDAAIVDGDDTGTVTEDGTLTASGTLTIDDIDSAETFQVQSDATTTYGTFSIDADGDWNYALDNANGAVQALNTGQTLTDTITVLAADGTAHDIVVTINGTNEGGGNTLYVGVGGFATIQAAIDASQAGDTIVIADGTYTEQLHVDGKINLTIRAEHDGLVKVLSPDVLAHNGDSNHYGGLDVRAVIAVNDSTNVTISGLVVDGSFSGDTTPGSNGDELSGIAYLRSSGSIAGTVIENVGNSVGGGLFGLQHGSGLFIDGDGGAGGLAVSVTGSTIRDFQKTGVLVFGVDLSFLNNSIISIGATGLIAQNGLQIGNAQGVIDGNVISGFGYTGGGVYSSGIIAYEPAGALAITNNDITGAGAGSAGIDLSDVDGVAVTISGNDFASLDYGVYAYTYTGTGGLGLDTAPVLSGNSFTDIGVEGLHIDPEESYGAGFTTSNPFNLTGTAGADTLAGSLGNDNLDGAGANDILRGNGGDDTLTGGAGAGDIAIYAGARGGYTYAYTTDSHGRATAFTGVDDTNPVGGDEGTDSLSGVEVLQFLGQALNVNDPVQLFDASNNLVGTFTTIQAAVDASSAGYTLRIAAGTYTENVNFHTAVTVLGAHSGEGGATRTGANAAGETTLIGRHDITAATGAVTLDGLRFVNNGSTTGGAPDAILQILTGGGHVVTNSVFYSEVQGGNRPSPDDRAISMPVIGDGQITISNNYFTGAFTGGFSTASWGRAVWFDGGGVDLAVTGNTIEYSRTGLNLDMSGDSQVAVSGNHFITTGTAVAVGVDTVGLTFLDNDFTNAGEEFNFRNLTGPVVFDAETAVDAQAGDYINVLGGQGGDTLRGTSGADVLDGNQLNVNAADGDTLEGRGGDDILFGRGGYDTAVFSGNRSDYQVNFVSTGVVQVIDLRPGSPDGTDTLVEIERALFADEDYSIDPNTGVLTLINFAPTAVDDVDSAIEDGPTASGSVAANDSDPDPGETATLSYALDAPVAGLTLNLNGGYSFDPSNAAYQHLALGATVDVVAAYTVTDENGASDSGTLTITITGTNDAPVVTGTASGTAVEAISLDNATPADQAANNRFEPTISYDAQIVSLLAAHNDDMPAVLSGLLALLPAGSNGLADAIALIWDYVDDNYSYYDTIINEISARLSVEYARYLVAGGVPLTGVVVKYAPDGGDGGSIPDRVQSMHDNLLGNLSIAGLNDKLRGPPNGSNPNPDETAYNQIIALLATHSLSDIVNRPYYGGSEGEPNLALAYDQAHGLQPVTGGTLTATDADDDAVLTWSGSATGIYGSIAIAANGTWRYTLDNLDPQTQALAQGATAIESFTATVTDNHGATATQIVTITITGTNDAPVAQADVASAIEDGAPVLGSVATNDSDVDTGASLSYALAAPVAGLTLNPNGSYVFDPADAAYQHIAQGATQVVIAHYTVTDGLGGSSTSTLTITLTGTNDAPVVTGPVMASATEGGGLYTFDPLANASDPDDGDGLVVVPVGPLPAGVSFVGGSAATISFSDYALGSVVGQHGWTDGSPGSPDNEIVDVLGNRMLRLANDPTSGDFAGPFSPAFAISAGEGGAAADTLTFSFVVKAVSGVPDGSRLEIDLGSSDRDDRYNFMAIEYTADGLRLVQNTPQTDGNWQSNDFDFGTGSVQLGALLSASVSHTIQVVFRAVDGSNNDIVEYYVDGVLVGTGSTFENFAEFHLGNPHGDAINSVNSVLFRAGDPAGNPFPADGPGGNRQGFYIDDLAMSAFDSHQLQFNANDPAYDHLAAGQTQLVTVNYNVADGHGGVTPASTVITVTGTNDGATITGIATGAVVESGVGPGNTPNPGTPTATGTLTVSDVDDGENELVPILAGTPGAGGYGTFEVLANGQWTYTLNNADADTNALSLGASVTDTIIVHSEDGTDDQLITVTITGTNDAPVATGVASGTATEGVSLSHVVGADQSADGRFEPDADHDAQIVSLLGAHNDDMPAVLAGLQALLPTGANGLAEAIAVMWDYVDDHYSYYDTVINEISARLSIEYARYLVGGGAPLTGVVVKYTADGGDVGTAPDRLQSLHDNLLGNLSLAGLNDKLRGPPNGSNPTPDEQAYQDIIALLATHNLSDIVNRPYHGGSEGEANAATAYDQAHGLQPATSGLLTATDPDDDAVLTWSGSAVGIYGSIAIAANGTWTYTLDNLDADTQALAQGATAIETFTATVTDNHGATATQLITITITGTNDAPVARADVASGIEDGALITGSVAVNDSDVDTGASLSYALEAPVAGLTLNTNGSYSFNPSNAAYSHLAQGEIEVVVAHYVVSDGLGGTSSSTLSITLTGVNDAPVLDLNGPSGGTGSLAIYIENTTHVAMAPAATLVDPDSPDFSGGQLTVTISANGTASDSLFVVHEGNGAGEIGVSGGTISYGGIAIGTATGGGASPLVITLNAAASQAAVLALVRHIGFATAGDNPSTLTRSVQFSLTDGDGGTSNTATSSVVVSTVNDAPSGTDATVTIDEDNAYVFALGDFGFSDPVDGNSFVAVVISTLPTNGSLFLNGDPVSLAGTFVSAFLISSGQLVFQPAPSGNGTSYAGFSFQVVDSGGTANGGVDTDPTPNFFTFNVNPVNDAPEGSNSTQVILEDATYTFSMASFGYSDPLDGNAFAGVIFNAAPTGGTLYYDADGVGGADPVAISGFPTGVYSAADIADGKLTFVADHDLFGDLAASVTFQVVDDGGNALGGIDTDQSPNTIRFDITPVNDEPVLTATSLSPTYTEDGPAVDLFSGVTASTVEAGQTFTGMTLTVTNVTDAASEILSFDGSDIALTDGNSVTTATNGLIVTVTLVGSTATVSFSLAALDADQLQTLVDGLTYRNASQAPTDGNRVVTITALADSGAGGGPDDNVAAPGLSSTVNVDPVNDGPANSVPGAQTVNEDGTLVLSGANALSVSDVDAGTLQVTLTATHGTLTLSGVTGLAFTAGDGSGDATMTFTGTIAAINAALNGLTFAAAADYHGPASISLTTSDQGSTGSGGVLADADSVSITIVSVNDAPAGTDKAITINEDSAYTFAVADFGYSDTADGNALAAVVITTLPANGTLLLNNVAVTLGQAVAASEIALGHLTFQPAPNGNGAGYGSFTFQVRDDGGTANGGVDTDASANAFAINVTALNDAPVNSVPGAQTVNEDGTLVLSGATALSVADVDASVLTVTLAVAHGTLTMTSIAGLTFGAGDGTADATMTFTGSVAAINAALAAGLTYVPAANYNGGDAISVTTTDNGQTGVGGTLTDGDSIAITIDPVNDQPSGADKTITLVEDGSYTVTVADFGFSDPIDGDAFLGVFVNGVPAQGELRLNGVLVISGQTIFVADIAAGLLVFTPAANGNGAAYGQFSFQVLDNGGGINFDPSSNKITFDVTAVNDAPAGTSATIVMNEDGSRTLAAADFGFSDAIDGNGFAGVVIATLPANGTLLLNGGAITAGTFVTAAQIAANQLVYTPAANGNGATYASFTFQVRDGGGTANGGVDTDASPNTLTFNVTAVNDAPAGTSATIVMSEDGSRTLAAADFGFSDPVEGNGFAGVVITTLPANGTLLLNGGAIVAGTFVTAAQIAANQLVYSPAANGNGATYASFTFQVRDDGGTANGGIDTDASPNTLTFNVTAVNDAPSAAIAPLGNATENVALSLKNQVTLADIDDPSGAAPVTVTVSVGYGVLNATAGTSGASVSGNGTGTLTLTGTLAQIQALLGPNATSTITFTANTDTPPASAMLSVTINDGGNGGPGALTATATQAITILPVNDAPSGAGATVATTENDVYVFSRPDFGFSDVDGNGFAAVRITTLPAHGQILLNGVAVTAGQLIPVADLDAGHLTFAVGAYAAPALSFTFQVQDDGGTANGGMDIDQSPATFSFTVTSDNVAPVVDLNGAGGGVNSSATYNENAAGIAIGAGIAVSDANEGLGDQIVSATVTLTNAGAGDLLTYGALPPGVSAVVTTPAGQIVITFTGAASSAAYAAILAGIRYSNSSDTPLAGDRLITVSVSDGELSSPTATATITVVPSDDPGIAHADAITTNEATIYSGNVFADNGSGADTDPDSVLAVSAVNGSAGNVGVAILLASGALLTLNANGSFTYNPNGAFNSTPAPGSGASNTTVPDSFTYSLAGGGTATVSVTITGLDSNDILLGTAGLDVLAGGGGNDIYYIENAGDVVIEGAGGGFDTIYTSTSYALGAGVQVETLSVNDHGATSAINLTGNEFANNVYGNNGANTLNGGAGADIMLGFGGNDIFLVDNGGDLVIEGAGGGFDIIYTSTSYVLGTGVQVETLSVNDHGATSAINLTGNAFDNNVYGNNGANTLDGGAGADIMLGFGGNDIFLVDNAGDVVIESAGGGFDIIYTSTSYTLGAGSQVETLSVNDHGATSAINLTGNELGNNIYGNNGANTLNGGAGADIMLGFGGNDIFYVDNAGDLIGESAGGGFDTVYSFISYTLGAGVQVETLSVTDHSATTAINLTGNELGNNVYGNAGANILNGGAGADLLLGLGGADTFAFTTALGGGNVDLIADFVSGTDKIALDDAIFTTLGLGALGANAFVIGSAAGDADDRIIYNSATGEIFYDADGNGAGGQILFAVLHQTPALAAGDFTVI